MPSIYSWNVYRFISSIRIRKSRILSLSSTLSIFSNISASFYQTEPSSDKFCGVVLMLLTLMGMVMGTSPNLHESIFFLILIPRVFMGSLKIHKCIYVTHATLKQARPKGIFSYVPISHEKMLAHRAPSGVVPTGTPDQEYKLISPNIRHITFYNNILVIDKKHLTLWLFSTSMLTFTCPCFFLILAMSTTHFLTLFNTLFYY